MAADGSVRDGVGQTPVEEPTLDSLANFPGHALDLMAEIGLEGA